MSFIKLALLLPAAAYLLVMLFALVFGNRLTFPAPPANYSDSPSIDKFVYSEDGSAVSMVFLNHPDSRYLIFFHHGNGEDLQTILPRLETLRSAGFSVLAWDYPGYGTSDGRPTESLILNVASRIMKSVPDLYGYQNDRIIQYGRSIGSGPAVWLAGEFPSAGLILEGAFTSVFRVITRIRLLPWDIFDNLSRIKSVKCPILCIHGTNDQTVPFDRGRTLFDRAPGRKFFAWFEGGRHNNLVTDFPDTYESSIKRFQAFLDGEFR